MWWMLAGVALQAVQKIGANKAQAVLDKANNKRMEAYNKTVALQAAKSFNEINLQKTALTSQVQQALASTYQQGEVEKSQRGVLAAATDTMGASVEQGLLDVDLKVDQAKEALMYNASLSDASLNAQAMNVADGSGFSLKAEKPVVGNNWGAAIGEAMAEVGMSMFENKMKTGSFTGAKTSRNQGL